MHTLRTFTVDHIRTLYTSGLYHKADLYLRFRFELGTPDKLTEVLNYVVYPEVRPELRMKVFMMKFLLEIVDDYHTSLQEVAIGEHISVLEDPKHAPASFAKTKLEADKRTSEKLEFLNEEFSTSFTLYDVQSRLYRNC